MPEETIKKKRRIRASYNNVDILTYVNNMVVVDALPIPLISGTQYAISRFGVLLERGKDTGSRKRNRKCVVHPEATGTARAPNSAA
jgi:hypothetical protein